ncbi:MAG: hypothetical protein WBF38_09065 [Nitrosotalea sp.]
MAEPKHMSHFIAIVTVIALLNINMQCVAYTSFTIQADEVDYATT